ncbi:MAG: hypothetical protein RI907_3326 [Pseudomonadota bacterium]
MSRDPMDLPVRQGAVTVRPVEKLPAPATASNRNLKLNEQHVTALVNTGTEVAQGVLSIAKDVVDIMRIRQSAQAEVAVIDARTRAVVDALRAETAKLLEVHNGVRVRGEVATQVIRTVLDAIPEADRLAALAHLNDLVAKALDTGDSFRR